ncbi:gamma-glutamylcyclotransferase [Ruegeria pomeroyi]|nr:gamma-glutamylcyclotransferase [Ruegeria pomeroyi]
MADPYFFGYGSLVNLATHDFPDPRPARLHGWRRVWRHTDLRQVAFLTALPDADCSIDGMIAHVPNDDWQALDAREWAYDRVAVTDHVRHDLKQPAEIAVYAVAPEKQSVPSTRHPILLSYIDVVVQGYLHAFGREGVRDFFNTTSGWEAPILDDRSQPRYPRHQQLKAEETDLVDRSLIEIGACIVAVS